MTKVLPVPSQEGEVCKDDLETTKKAIETAHQICLMATDSHAELQVELPKLFECIQHPIVSLGVLRWVEYTLTDPTFFEVAAESSSLFLVLLDEVSMYRGTYIYHRVYVHCKHLAWFTTAPMHFTSILTLNTNNQVIHINFGHSLVRGFRVDVLTYNIISKVMDLHFSNSDVIQVNRV